MSSSTDRASLLARRVRRLSDPQMRVAYVRHELAQLQPADVADLITVIAGGAKARDEAAATLMLTISIALADPQAQALRRRVVAAAARRGLHDVARLLDDRRAGGADPEAEDNHPVPDFGRGRPLTLGERKSLARRNDRNLIARVLRDPHPDVIGILLGNPSVTEDDVVRLCARRPVPPEVLRQVFRSPRWVLRYRVRRALVRNPHCPLDVALQLTAHLNAQDAREVANSPELADEVRRACRREDGEQLVH
ncbi:MAG: hypothetical protein ACOCUS_00720 [Polyangiales bacterium]